MFRVLKMAAEHATEGIVVVDASGTIRFANEVCAKAHGYPSRANLLGRDLNALHSQQQMTDYVTPFMKEAARLGCLEGQLDHVRRNGVPFSAATKMTLIIDDAGDDAGFIIFHKDAAEAAAAREPEPPAAAGNEVPATFCQHLLQPVKYRYGDNGDRVDENKGAPAQLSKTGKDSPRGAESPERDGEETDRYLEMRKAFGGPLDTTKLAELARLMRRLG